MQGEINITEIMERQSRLRAWCERQVREAEWVALKQWWKAEHQVHVATNEDQLTAALALRSQTARLYATELRRAWPKWQKVQKDRGARRLAHHRHRRTAGRPSTGLPRLASTID